MDKKKILVGAGIVAILILCLIVTGMFLNRENRGNEAVYE